MVNNPAKQTERFQIDPGTVVGAVTLGVDELEKMAQFYEQIIGLKISRRSVNSVELGIDGSPIVILESRPGRKQFTRSPGLFHLAIQLPTRQDLGLWLAHLAANQYPLDGAGDHIVSEALYLSDPEGNGIEIYSDRPRESWHYINSQIKMDTLPVDLDSLRREAPRKEFNGLPKETTLGHVHLKVSNIDKSTLFYRDVLGFDLMASWHGAIFLSAGGYHHHIGANIWNSRGAAPRPPDSLGLIAYQILLPTADARQKLIAHLDSENCPMEYTGTDSIIRDPAGNGIILKTQ